MFQNTGVAGPSSTPVSSWSDGGARVKLNAPVQVPQVFLLRFADSRVRRCKVRRRNALELGVEFLD